MYDYWRVDILLKYTGRGAGKKGGCAKNPQENETVQIGLRILNLKSYSQMDYM